MNATQVRKSEIVSILRSRGKGARADWFERELPAIVDTGENSSLLATLDIDVNALRSADRSAQEARPVTTSGARADEDGPGQA